MMRYLRSVAAGGLFPSGAERLAGLTGAVAIAAPAQHAGPVGSAVSMQGVSKVYGTVDSEPVEALAPLDLEIEAGQFVTVVGPSGCGKSTLMMLMAGLLPVSGGTITIGGERVDRPHPDMSVVFQSDLLLPWRTILDNVLLPVEIKGWGRDAYRERAEELLVKVGLDGFGSRYPSELSGGMRQRVAICRALIQRTGLMLMDEPFGALDALTREQMSLDLQKLWSTINNTVVFITHSIEEAVFLSDRVIVMSPRPGRIELDLTIELGRPRTWKIHTEPRFVEYMMQVREVFERAGVLSAE